jgi:imidazoleglycerol-phosphate dehydratase
MRCASHERTTRETAVRVKLDLDERGPSMIVTGSAMFDHLLEAFALHARIALEIQAQAKDSIQHHVVEDVAIVLGKTIAIALGERTGIARYGEASIPMDEALVRCVLDLAGRSYARIALPLRRERIEDLASDLIPHFFSSLASNAGITLHLDALAGENDHHVVEAAFKAFARAARVAWTCSLDALAIPSTKGML